MDYSLNICSNFLITLFRDAADESMKFACDKRQRYHYKDIENAIFDPKKVGVLNGYSERFIPHSETVLEELQEEHRYWFSMRRCELIVGIAVTALLAFTSLLVVGMSLIATGIIYRNLSCKVDIAEEARSIAYLVHVQSCGSRGEDPRLGITYSQSKKKNLVETMRRIISVVTQFLDVDQKKMKEAAQNLKKLIVNLYVEHLIEKADVVNKVMESLSDAPGFNAEDAAFKMLLTRLPEEFANFVSAGEEIT